MFDLKYLVFNVVSKDVTEGIWMYSIWWNLLKSVLAQSPWAFSVDMKKVAKRRPLKCILPASCFK